MVWGGIEYDSRTSLVCIAGTLNSQRYIFEWLQRWIPYWKAWVRFPIPPNALRVHTEYVLVKPVGPKVLWVVAAETTSAGSRRMFPSPPVPCLNCGGGDRWYRHLS
ncbi:uncharacterized protein TNCV_1568941 [Trichonephila clavipes]|nr:uncharacterized protein TNCV_1568941 [Trichonephila clavipes]